MRVSSAQHAGANEAGGGAAVAARRVLVACLALGVIAAGETALVRALEPGGWSAVKWVILGCGSMIAPWAGLCAANGLAGFAILVGARDPVRAVFPAGGPISAPPPRIAIAVTVRDEDMAAVLPPLARLLDGLDALGAGAWFTLCILSDTRDPARAGAEEAAVAGLRARLGGAARVFYRRRSVNAGFKAGNIMDFLDRDAAGFELMLTLDADSAMSARAVLRLVDAMRRDPTLGIVQHLAIGLPAAAAFPRLFQFGMRAGMRTWAIGQAWWQDDAGPYWGHNAIVRVAPFRAHARLPLLPGGAPILSHDQVEAALLRAAGWGVRVLPAEDGSAEAHPPALPEFLRRELRWLAGNMQYRHLLLLPGLRPMGRWQLGQAILLFAGAPLETGLFAAAAWAAASGAPGLTVAGVAPVLAFWFVALRLPKLLGYLEVALFRARRARYGGGARLAAGIAAETLFTLLLEPIGVFSKTLAMVRLARGTNPGWLPQNRADRPVSWPEAARLFWPHSLAGAIGLLCFAAAGWRAAACAAPFIAGLLLAIPFCVLTADRRLGALLARRGVAAMPEEL